MIIEQGEETLTIYTRLTFLSLIFIYSIIFVSLDAFLQPIAIGLSIFVCPQNYYRHNSVIPRSPHVLQVPS